MVHILDRLDRRGRLRAGVCVLGIMLVSATSARAAGSPHLDANGFLLVDGAPRLILGTYELPGQDERLAQLAAHGFNLVRVGDRAGLDRVGRHGLYGWITLNPRLAEGDASAATALRQRVTGLKDHPALLVWELPDEIVWNVWWSRVEWALGGQGKALRARIEKVTAEDGEQRAGALLARLDRAEDLRHRGLFGKAEAIYDALWPELGEENPRPDAGFAHCPEITDRLTEDMARGCALLRTLDPGRIIWQNHAPRNAITRLRSYNRMVDAAGCDIYPAPFAAAGHSDLRDVRLSSVGAYTERMAAAAPGKAVWMVLQGFGWRDIQPDPKDAAEPEKRRRPNLRETRFMAYDAIVHGAHAVLYYGTYAIDKDGDTWADLMAVGRELRALEPAIVGARPERAPTALAAETFGSIDPDDGPVLMLRRSGTDWVLIAVNDVDEGVAFSVGGLPDALEGRRLHRLYTAEEHVVRDGAFQDGIRSFGVQVYATSRRFEVD